MTRPLIPRPLPWRTAGTKLSLLRIGVLALGFGAAGSSVRAQIFDPTPSPTPVGYQAGRAGWKLVSVVVEPEKHVPRLSTVKSLEITRCKFTARIKDSSVEAAFSEPPPFIGEKETVTLEVSTSYSGNDDNVGVSVSMNTNGTFHIQATTKIPVVWPWGEKGEAYDDTVYANSSRPSARSKFDLTPDAYFRGEGLIYPQVFYGANEGPVVFEARYAWVDSYFAEPTPSPTPPRGECAELLERYMAARFRVVMLQEQLEMWRGLQADYERRWNMAREEGFFSGLFDIASMALTGAASVRSQAERMLALQFGKFTARSVAEMIFKSAAKAVLKESAKELTLRMTQDKGWEPLTIGQKALEGTGKKLIAEALGDISRRRIVEMINDRWGAFKDPNFRVLLNPDGTRMIKVIDHVQAQYSQAWADAFGMTIDAYWTVYKAWTAHGKLETLRKAIGHIRDRRILPAERELAEALADVDVAKSAYEGCLKFHPGERVKP